MNLLDDCVVFINTYTFPHLKGVKLEGFNENGKAFIEGSTSSHDYEFVLEKHAGKALKRELKQLTASKTEALAVVEADFDRQMTKILRDYPRKRRVEG